MCGFFVSFSLRNSINNLDINRFKTESMKNKNWIINKSHESYARNYDIMWPRDEPLASRDVGRDVLYDKLIQQGCIFGTSGERERPLYFVSDGIVSNSSNKVHDEL